jgi:hypothetical protein
MENLDRSPNHREDAMMKRLPVLFSVLLVFVLAVLAVRAGTPVFLPHASPQFFVSSD